MKKNVLTTIFVSFITAILTGTITVFAANGLLSSEVAYNDDNTQLGQTNVQGAIEKLYADANNYSRINGYFQNNPTSFFSGNGLVLGKQETSHSWLDLYHKNVVKGNIYTVDNGLTVSSPGSLILNGNNIKLNNSLITAPTKINLSAQVGTMATNNSYYIGDSVNINLKVQSITSNANSTIVLTTLPVSNRPSSEVSCYAFANNYATTACWVRTTGEVCAYSASSLSNGEIRVIGSFLK